MGSKVKPSPSKQSVKFKCQIQFEITKKYPKKCLDESSLWHSRKNMCLDASTCKASNKKKINTLMFLLQLN